MELIEDDDIEKRWQEYTEELHKEGLHDLDNQWCDHSRRARHPGV